MKTTNTKKCWFSQDISGCWWFIWVGDDFIERRSYVGKKLYYCGADDWVCRDDGTSFNRGDISRYQRLN